MADLITTLKKKGDTSTNVYPNIKKDNIPSGAISTDKIENGAVSNAKLSSLSVTESKIGSGAVTSSKIQTGAVNNSKIADGSITNNKIADGTITNAKISNGTITTEKIADGSVTNDKIAFETITSDRLSNELQKLLANLTHGYYIMAEDNEGYESSSFLATTTLSYEFDEFTTEEIEHALDLDYNQSDRTARDLKFYSLIIDGINKDLNNSNSYPSYATTNTSNGWTITLFKDLNNHYNIKAYNTSHTLIYHLEFTLPFNIITYVNNDYVYLNMYKILNTNIKSIDIDE